MTIKVGNTVDIGKQFDHLREVFKGASGGSNFDNGIHFIQGPMGVRFDPEHHPDPVPPVGAGVRPNNDAVPVTPESKQRGSLAHIAKQMVMGGAQGKDTTRVRIDSVRKSGKGTAKGTFGSLVSRGVVADGQIGWRVMHSSELGNEGPLKHLKMSGWSRADIRDNRDTPFARSEEARRQHLANNVLGRHDDNAVNWRDIGERINESVGSERDNSPAALARKYNFTPWKKPEDIEAGNRDTSNDDKSFEWMRHHKDYKEHAHELLYGSGEGPDWFKSSGQGSIKSERGSRGSTMFSSTWNRADSPSFARPPEHIGGSYHLVAVDLSGLPFKSLRKPETGEATPAGSHHDIHFDVGLGLGVTGKIPHSRILHVINMDDEGKPDFENGWTHDGTKHRSLGEG
jgi:hypothetical protein